MALTRFTLPSGAPAWHGDRRIHALVIVLGVTLLGDGLGTVLGRIPTALVDVGLAGGLAAGRPRFSLPRSSSLRYCS
ncbi:hypothetical protein [Natronorubrum sp. DTA28]|uniref:hypothetical protein n=1 Tax=Natronorubrum sp. DTA28 TaxID=3447019 RepID=UPI003F860053